MEKKHNYLSVDAPKRKVYISPMLRTVHIKMENSIAAGSATINPNGPEIEDWHEGGNLGNKDFDL